MTGTALPATLPDLLRGWNVVDVALVVFLALSALDGLRRGLLAGLMGLIATVLTIGVAFRTYPMAATWLRDHSVIPPSLTNVAGFFAVLMIGQLVLSTITRIIYAALLPARRRLGPLVVL